jgi:hypothetical protein
MTKSSEQHQWDKESLAVAHKRANGTAGGKCLARHVSEYKEFHSCSHRWQAYEQANAAGNPFRKNYLWPEDGPPPGSLKGDASIGVGDNFKEDSTVPYAHEAHHIVAAAELANGVNNAAKGHQREAEVVLLIREGLLNESYNLNYKTNMIILPMVRAAARVLGLPTHRKTRKHLSHAKYSKYVKEEVKKAFAPIQKDLQTHERLPNYKPTRKKIEAVSKDTYPGFFSAGELMRKGKMKGHSIDDIPADHFRGGARPKSGRLGGQRP